jgi:hypothetical protein
MNKASTINHAPNCTSNMYQHNFINYAQHNLSQQPVISTCLINLINQIRSIHQYQSPRQLSTICKISSRCASTKTTHKHQQDVPQSRCVTSSIIHMPILLLPSASDNVPSMYQSFINYRSSYDSSMYQHHNTIHFMYVPTHQLYVPICSSTICQKYVPNVYQACI